MKQKPAKTRRIKKVEPSNAAGVLRITLECGHLTYALNRKPRPQPGQIFRCEKCGQLGYTDTNSTLEA